MSNRYRVVPIEPDTDQMPEILDVLEHFNAEEPCFIISSLPRHRFYDWSFASMARCGISTMAIDTETGKVVGAYVGKIFKDKYSAWETFQNWIWSIMMPWLYWLFETPEKYHGHEVVLPFLFDVTGYTPISAWFSSLGCSKFVSDTYLVVSPEARGANLGERMIVLSDQLAKERAGCTYSVAMGTGIYSQRIFDKLGYTLVKETRYDEVRMEDGSPLPNLDRVPPEHKSAKLLTKAL